MKINEIYSLRKTKLDTLGYESYQEDLLSDEWKNIKSKIKNRKAKRWNFCNVCGADKNLDLHHSSYKVIGLENPGNTVKLLCRVCHEEVHRLSKENPSWSLYRACGRLRSSRKKAGMVIFKYTKDKSF